MIDHTVRIFGVPFSLHSWEELLKIMEFAINNESHGYISVTNTESTYFALRNEFHRKYIQNAVFSCCDGIGIVLSGRLLGYRIPRMHGPDLMLRACEHGIDKHWRHFFYGGRDGIPSLLSRNLKARFPGLCTAGTYSPPFRDLSPKEDAQVLSMINRSQADIVWVGLGLLKQERWIAEHRERVNAPWMIGVGAAFDFYAGTVRRAPKILRDIGLEWLYRVTFEPRMIVRNLRGIPIIMMAAKQALTTKLGLKS